MSILLAICTLLLGCLVSCQRTSIASEIALLPVPAEMEVHKGNFTLKDGMTIGYDMPELKPAADHLLSLLSVPTGYKFRTVEGKGDIRLALNQGEGVSGGYVLNITSEEVIVGGYGYGGVIAGISTLRQLLPPDMEAKTRVERETWELPCVSIMDKPRFEWRGLMLDVSRHFFSKEEVKELLDLMSLYKLNKFHWHLTDDQGWRIEIKKYPLLTQKGAWRRWNKHDRQCMKLAVSEDNQDFDIPVDKLYVMATDTVYGGFYTQDDIREIVSYAAVRGIDVIPEIDMPGHFLAAIGNYPGISCFEQADWGEQFSSPVCPGKEHALEFCKDVYKEVFELFPYEYVHIGGDEVEKNNWKKCPDCQRRMRENRLKDEKELHSWFIRHMEKFFNENGKQMIGWDEILEGGLSETATVMWWRTWQPNVVEETTLQGNNVICCPNAWFYLDYQQDEKSLKNIYEYAVLSEGMDVLQSTLVRGIQGNLWTERVPSYERLQYLVFPRLLAIAELAWSKPQRMNWDDFNSRMLSQLRRLNVLDVNYRIPDLEGFYHSNVFIDTGRVSVVCPDPSAMVRYTTDGTVPVSDSPEYVGMLSVARTTDFTFRTFRAGGEKEDIVRTRFIKQEYARATCPDTLAPGLKAVWHEYRGSSCREIPDAPVNGTYIIDDVFIPDGVRGNIGLVITGFMSVPKDDIYTFFLMSDDGSTLVMDDETVIDNDGAHSPREVVGQRALKAGYHPVEIRYFDYNGGLLELRVLDSAGNEVRGSRVYMH